MGADGHLSTERERTWNTLVAVTMIRKKHTTPIILKEKRHPDIVSSREHTYISFVFVGNRRTRFQTSPPTLFKFQLRGMIILIEFAR